MSFDSGVNGLALSKTTGLPIPAFGEIPSNLDLLQLREMVGRAVVAWLNKTPSDRRTDAYARDLDQFMEFLGIAPDHWELLLHVRPEHVQQWRDALVKFGRKPRTVIRKITTLRGLYSYLRNYGYVRANPAHSDFVEVPPEPRDGATVAMTAGEMRMLLDAPDPDTPVGIRDRAYFGVLAFGAVRVGEIRTLTVGDFRSDAAHRVLEIFGKGSYQRKGAVSPEAVERLMSWIDLAVILDDTNGPLFRPANSPRGHGRDGFKRRHMSTRAVQKLVKRYVQRLGMNRDISVHSFRVSAANRARELGVEIVDIQTFLGHRNVQTTLSYLRNLKDLNRSPAYVLKY